MAYLTNENYKIFEVEEKIERKTFIKSITDFFKKRQSVAVLSQERTGKSTFLDELYELLISKDKKTIFIKFEEIFSIKDLFEALKSEIEKISNKPIDINYVNDELVSLKDILNHIVKWSENENIYILIDDFDKIVDLQSTKLEINNLIENIFINSQNTFFCFTTTKHAGNSFFNSTKSSLYNFANTIALPPFNDIELSTYIINYFNTFGIVFDNDLIKNIVDITDRNPYYLKQICRNLVLCRDEKSAISDKIFNKVVDELYNSEKYIFKLRLNMMRKRKYLGEILRYVCERKNPYEIETIYNMPKSNISMILNLLEKENFITTVSRSRSHRYAIQNKFLERYLQDISTKIKSNKRLKI